MNIYKVAIVGGVHGNELTGINLINNLRKDPNQVQRNSFKSIYFLGNLRAIAVGKRYLETDLNRCFLSEDLNNPSLLNYEQLRAKEIADCIKQEQVDFIIDVHSTTSEMGITIILNSIEPFLLKLAAYLSHIQPSIKFLQYAHLQQFPYLRNLCPLGLTIEVGGIPHNCLNLALLEETERILKYILDYLDANNQNVTVPLASHVTLYQQVKVLDYPRDEQGQIRGKIAPYLQNYQPINPNKPIFLDFEGNPVIFEDQITYYPVFIGEASYREKGIAMGLTIPRNLDLNR